jgi:hypothetical protein
MRRRGFGSFSGGQARAMTFGASLFLMAVGAILRYAVKDSLNGVDLQAAGLILMLVGAVGFLIALYLTFVRRPASGDRYVEERVVERAPPR